MTTNLKSGGADLDTLFLARVNAKIADVGIKSGGTDISNLFETRGSSTKRADVGWKSAGSDISNLFRDKNLPLYSASAPTQVSGYCSRVSVGSCTATTSAAAVTVTGGVGPFTYAWEYVSGDTATIVSPSSASTTFTRGAAANFPINVKQGFYRCKVTDSGAGGAITYTNNVNVYTEHEFTG